MPIKKGMVISVLEHDGIRIEGVVTRCWSDDTRLEVWWDDSLHGTHTADEIARFRGLRIEFVPNGDGASSEDNARYDAAE